MYGVVRWPELDEVGLLFAEGPEDGVPEERLEREGETLAGSWLRERVEEGEDLM